MLDALFWWGVLFLEFGWWIFMLIYAVIELKKLWAAIDEIAVSYP